LVPAIRRELRAVADQTARCAAQAALKESEDFSKAVLNSLGAEIAVIDREGKIIAVNRPWMLSEQEEGRLARVQCPVGGNYLDACRKSLETDANPEAERACAGIVQVVQGELPDFTTEYVFHSSEEDRWFLLFVTPLTGRGGAVISHIDITERKRAEQEVHLLAHALRCTNDCVCLTDLNNRILFVNDAFLKTYGYQLNELIGQPVDMVYSDDNAPELLLAKASQTVDEGWKGEMRHRRRDETDFSISLSSSLIRDKDGSPIAFINVANDVTERKRAEDALRESEARFRAVVQSVAEGLLLTDLDEFILYANPRMTEMTGFTLAEMVGHKAYELLLPVEQWPEAVARTRRRLDGVSERYEIRLLRKDGGSFWTEIGAAPLRNVQGEIIGSVGAITDITERRRSREALQKSENSLLLAQRVGHVGSWEGDVNDNQLTWSDETFRIFGFEPHSFVPTRERFYGAVHPEDRDFVRKAVETAIRSGKPYGIDHRIVRPDGSERYVHEQAELITDAQGKIVRLVGTVQDITQRNTLEEQVRHSQKMEAVGQLAGGIAHDFNNILTIIQGYAELVSLNPYLDLDTRGHVGQISHSAERAARLTRQLLAFSRKQVIQLKTISLNTLLESSANMLQRLLGEHITLHLDLDSALPPIRADVGMMEQVLVNLTVNARDAMPEGGSVSVVTRLAQVDESYCRAHPDATPGSYALLTVSDTGCGIPPEILSHVFEPFFTTKEIGKGTGLGLSTVYGIVRQHKGWIAVSSEPAKGTIFEIYFPASPASLPPPIASNQPPPSRGGTETILLVEDEPALRALSRQSLQRYGYTILEASSGPEALRVWSENSCHIDLLLTDIVMPGGMSGRELASQLKKQNPSLKVLYTSGYSVDLSNSDPGIKLGVNFVPKPYLGTTIARAVRNCLDQARE
jgi:PAS domain S-box-containing protein